MTSKVVLCGTGFLGRNIARALDPAHYSVSIGARNPERQIKQLSSHYTSARLDITKPDTIQSAVKDASVVVSLVGLMHGQPEDFERIQWRGAENVARAAQSVGAKLIHISAIGADASSSIPYARTKALAEQSVFEICPTATVIRPSLVFGPGDDFFNRFASIAKILPFLPVFGGGTSLFQPVFVGDIARLVEIIARNDPGIRSQVDGKIIEAGGPDVLTYRQLMESVLKHSNRYRPILSLPFALGSIQGFFLEKLPTNLLTVTRAQVEQLKFDNKVTDSPSEKHASFRGIIESDKGTNYLRGPLKSIDEILPLYLGGQSDAQFYEALSKM